MSEKKMPNKGTFVQSGGGGEKPQTNQKITKGGDLRGKPCSNKGSMSGSY
ncbi:MAG: hypothetical protein PHQ35_09325 [Phycisphaerae bacterium]|nr:hypothetical protein [Phycisphaerae bacterium]MDD5239917.1 hypothetical protein [Candidatus Nanoarchaeia archaeon]